MGIGSAGTKRADTRTTRLYYSIHGNWRPVSQPLLQPEWRPGKNNIRVHRITVQRWHQHAVPQLQKDFDDTRHARCRFQMTNIRFNRTESTPLRSTRRISSASAYFRKRFGQAIDFDWVS